MMWILVTALALLIAIGCLPIDYQVSLVDLGLFQWLWKIQWSWGFGLWVGAEVNTSRQKESLLKRLLLRLCRSGENKDRGQGLLAMVRKAKDFLRDLEPYSVCILYGFEDPYCTGLITGLTSAFCAPWYCGKNTVILAPRFTQLSSERQIAISGQMPTAKFCYVVLKWFFFSKLFNHE